MKKKKIYVNDINKKIDNNQDYCDVLEKEEVIISKKLTIDEKLQELFNKNGYVFNVNVKIITDSKKYDTKIAGRVGNNIITLDNDVISIKDIKDIIF